MNLEDYINGAADLINKTPIRPIPAEIEKIHSDLNLLSEKCRQPLKIVLIGASNSGKSTLLNTLVGKYVSPVDVLETTAVIIRVKYAEKEQATIYFHEKKSTVGTIADIFHELEEHRNDSEFAESCREVEITMPLPALRNLELVDTPGLGTLTTRNHDTTINYIQEADVVLWTMHAAYINNQSIEDEIGEVYDLGKPMLCVVTHVDEVHATSEEIEDAIEDELPGYFKKIFPVNAYDACEIICNKTSDNLQGTGFTTLYDELINVYNNNSKQIQTDSLLDSTLQLIVKSKNIHSDEIHRWRDRRTAYRQIHEDLTRRCRDIEDKLTHDLDIWLDTDFLQEEQNLLQEKIDEISFTSTTSKEEEIKNLWNRIFSEENILKLVSDHVKSEQDHLANVWKDEIESLEKDIEKEYSDLLFNNQNVTMSGPETITLDSGLGNSSVTIGKTTLLSAAFGSAASAYAAGLGTYAAHLSMAGALGSFMPPALLAGVIIGIIKRGYDVRSTKKRWHEKVGEVVGDIRRKISRDILSGYRGTIQQCNRACQTAVEKEFLNKAFHLQEIEEVNKEIEAIELHRQELESYMDKSPTYGDVMENLSQRMDDLIKSNNELKKMATNGAEFSTLKQMKKEMEELAKAKEGLEQELDKKEDELNRQREELEAEKNDNRINKDERDKLTQKLEENRKEIAELKNKQDKMAADYKEAQKNVAELNARCKELQEKIDDMQTKFATLKELGIDLDAPDAFDKVEKFMDKVMDKVIEDEKNTYQEKAEYFKTKYPLYDDKTIKDLATGELLRAQFIPFKEAENVDFSPALLPALVTLERVMREYYSRKNFLKYDDPLTCPWATICGNVKTHEFHWRPGFGNELFSLKDVRNQTVHVGNINYNTYDTSYKMIVMNTDSVIAFIYTIVTKK